MKFSIFLILQTFIFANLIANFLDQKLPEIKEISREAYSDLPSREYEDVTLDGQDFKNIKFSISYPKRIEKNENVLLLLDGLETGRESLKYVPHPKNYIIIGYEYEKSLHYLRKKSVFFHLPSTRKAILDVPFQIVSIVQWIEKQPWYSHKNVIIIGVSFGAIFVPATFQLALMNDIQLGPGIMAYGGAELYDIFYANLKNYKILRKPLAFFAYQLFKPIDPVFHLPYIHGKFLIINGTQDKNIPLQSAQKLQELTPEPKTIINIDTEHMAPDRKDIIDQIVKISLNWLENNQ